MSTGLTRLLGAALVASALSACGGTYAVQSASTAAFSQSGLHVSIQLSSGAATAISVAAIAAIAVASEQTYPRPPEMMQDRTIHEQDCTQPITNLAANLKCR